MLPLYVLCNDCVHGLIFIQTGAAIFVKYEKNSDEAHVLVQAENQKMLDSAVTKVDLNGRVLSSMKIKGGGGGQKNQFHVYC
jgi:hypothetical protein